MKINLSSTTKARYLFTFLLGNNLLALFLAVANHNPSRRYFWETLLVVLVVSHITALISNLSMDIFGPLLLRLVKIPLGILYFLLALFGLMPGLYLGFSLATLVAQKLGIDWHPDILEIFLPGVIFALIILILNSLLLGWMSSVQKKQAQEIELMASKIQILKAELNPHLLFNLLTGVMETIDKDPKRAEIMLAHLCDYYQSVLVAFNKDAIMLKDEIDLGKKFIKLQKWRFKNLTFKVYLSDANLEKFLVPPLILQPLIENSLKHGFSSENSSRKNIIKLEVKKTNDKLRILINDNGAAKIVEGVEDQEREHHGLANSRKRLKLFYKKPCEIALSKNDEGALVVVELPYV